MNNLHQNIKPNIEDLLNLYSCKADGKTKTVSVYQYVDFSYKEEFVFGYEEVRKVHPLFPEALQALCGWHTRTMGHGHPSSTNVVGTLRLLRGDVVSAVDEHGKDYVFTRVKDIDELPTVPGVVFISGDRYVHEKKTVGDVSVPIVIACLHEMHGVTKVSLDENYPGWMERWTIGEELGLRGFELTHQAFPKTQLPEAIKLDREFTFD